MPEAATRCVLQSPPPKKKDSTHSYTEERASKNARGSNVIRFNNPLLLGTGPLSRACHVPPLASGPAPALVKGQIPDKEGGESDEMTNLDRVIKAHILLFLQEQIKDIIINKS